MATLNTYFPVTSRRFRRILAVGALALASTLSLNALEADTASANHSTKGPPGWGCAESGTPPIDPAHWGISPDILSYGQLQDALESSVRCIVNHWRTDSRAPAADTILVDGRLVPRTRPSNMLALGHRSTLRRAARVHAADLASRFESFFRDLRPTSRRHCSNPPFSSNPNDPCLAPNRPADRVQRAGYCGSESMFPFGLRAENIAHGSAATLSPANVVELWRDPRWTQEGHIFNPTRPVGDGNGHWASILTTSANEQGVGVSLFRSGQAEAYTLDFGRAGSCPTM
jgi:hypothetical protein